MAGIARLAGVIAALEIVTKLERISTKRTQMLTDAKHDVVVALAKSSLP